VPLSAAHGSNFSGDSGFERKKTEPKPERLHHTSMFLATGPLASASTTPAESRRWILYLELVLIFGLIPALLYRRLLPNFPIPILICVALAALGIAQRFPNFSLKRLFHWSGARSQAFSILTRDFFFMGALGIAVWRFAPDLLFSLVRTAPIVWLAIVILYPLFSVLPQEFLFRAYFFRRYETIFGRGSAMIAASAIAFGFVHVIFGNWLAVLLSAIGGVLFSTTYLRTASLTLVWLEHALFGDFLFTIGLGRFFFHGH
jgi:CAAX protease family protein